MCTGEANTTSGGELRDASTQMGSARTGSAVETLATQREEDGGVYKLFCVAHGSSQWAIHRLPHRCNEATPLDLFEA